ncbi:glycosyltransferase family 39 protein [bacterium]|nr:glycosyltransferase family 39 protein [bacterium]
MKDVADQHATGSRSRMNDYFAFAVAFVGVGFIVRFAVLALLRINYPYQLEWIEGGVLEHVRRVLEGRPLYAPPSLEWIAFIYPPFYYWVSAAAAWVMGFGFAPLRLVSLVSSIATMAIMADMVRRETGVMWAGLITAGMYAASYDMTDRWMDLGRVDGLFICLTLASVYVFHYFGERGVMYCVASGALAACAVLTKQTAAIALAPAILFDLAKKPMRLWAMPASAAAIFGVAVGWLEWSSAGWFRFYTFDMPGSHAISRPFLVWFWKYDLWHPIPIAILLAVAGLVLAWRHRGQITTAYYIVFSFGFIFAAEMARIKVGGWVNCVLPAFVAIMIMAGISLGMFAKNPKAARIMPALLFAAGAQFWHLHGPEARAIPTAADRAAGRQFEQLLSSIPEVYAPGSGYLEARVGKKSHAHSAAYWDLLTSNSERAKQLFLDELIPRLRARRFDAIILNDDMEGYLYRDELKANYYQARGTFMNSDVFMTRSGLIMRPNFVWLPRRD